MTRCLNGAALEVSTGVMWTMRHLTDIVNEDALRELLAASFRTTFKVGFRERRVYPSVSTTYTIAGRAPVSSRALGDVRAGPLYVLASVPSRRLVDCRFEVRQKSRAVGANGSDVL